LGVRPTWAPRCSVAVDKAETSDLGLRIAFATAPEDQPRGRADPTCEQKTDAERADRGHRQIRPQLRAHVRRLADAIPQRLGGVGELFALALDLAPDVRDGAGVVTCHCSSGPRSLDLPHGSADRGRGALLSW